jgi:hypothetical protein
MRWFPFTLVAVGCGLLLEFSAFASTLYVDANGINPVAPYTTWDTAAITIQDAVNASTNGDLVLVTNGIYATGGRKWFDSGTNRVTLTNAIILKSVNGPSVTWIVGNHVTGTGPILTNTVRCVGMGNNAVLSGFTLTNGEAGGGNYLYGGGVANLVSVSPVGLVTNCVLVSNLASNSAGGGAYRVILVDCQILNSSARVGGGACSCTLIRCALLGNSASSGGAAYGTGVSGSFGPCVLSNCTITGNSAISGGGVYGVTLNNSVVSNNVATTGGGVYSSSLNNCLIVSNTAGNGGGIYGGLATNCTVVLNTATNITGSGGGGVDGGSGAWLYNCIVYYNAALSGSNNTGAKFNNSCTVPNLVGAGITNAPLLVGPADGNFHLQSNSPCINSGNNAYVSTATDLDGNPRIAGGTVDVGAYEYQSPSSILSYAWAQQFGLPTDGLADAADTDSDGMSNFAEWKAGTVPTNAASVLQLAAPSNSLSGITVTWQSVTNITYYLQRSSDLTAPFSGVQSNIVGQTGTTSYTDITATNNLPYFYRVGVQ